MAKEIGSGQSRDAVLLRFFVAAVLFTLTAGAAWGAYLLWRIGSSGSFTAISLYSVNTHGHAQVMGWVGLFVMGFAHLAFPRFSGVKLRHPGLAKLSFVVMTGGILARIAGGLLWDRLPGLVAGTAGSAAEIVAVGLFIFVLFRTLRKAKAARKIRPYIGASVLWFLAATIYSGIHFFNTATAPTAEALVRIVALWQAPLRDIQIYGFAMLMILGVSLRLLPASYGVPETSRRKSRAALLLLNAGILGGGVFYVAFFITGLRTAALLRTASSMAILGTVLWLVLPWRLWSKGIKDRRGGRKFVRAAYLWLVISLIMVVLLPLYNALSGTGFSHAYFGAARHAVTVGFITMMILGVSSTENGGADCCSFSPSKGADNIRDRNIGDLGYW